MSFKSGVIGDESEGGDCDEVICTGWGEPGGKWTEWGWRNKEDNSNISRYCWNSYNTQIKFVGHVLQMLNSQSDDVSSCFHMDWRRQRMTYKSVVEADVAFQLHASMFELDNWNLCRRDCQYVVHNTFVLLQSVGQCLYDLDTVQALDHTADTQCNCRLLCSGYQ